MRGGRGGRSPGGPRPAKPLNWGQDLIPAGGAARTTPQLLPEAVATQDWPARPDQVAREDRNRWDADEGKWEVSRNSAFRETLINPSLFKPHGAGATGWLRAARPRLCASSFTLGSLLLSHGLLLDPENSMVKKTREVDYSHDQKQISHLGFDFKKQIPEDAKRLLLPKLAFPKVFSVRSGRECVSLDRAWDCYIIPHHGTPVLL